MKHLPTKQSFGPRDGRRDKRAEKPMKLMITGPEQFHYISDDNPGVSPGDNPYAPLLPENIQTA